LLRRERGNRVFAEQGVILMNKAHNGQGDIHPNEAAVEAEQHEGAEGGMNKTVATVAVVAAGVAVFEAALLPGVVLGVVAMAAPKYLPKLASSLGPLFKSTVRGTYKFAQKSKEMFAEAHEHVNDIVAEVRSEGGEELAKAARASKASPTA
jgi:hypothetical protein